MTLNLKPRKLWRMNGCIVISLPTEWIYHHHLEAGQHIKARFESNGKLVLEPIKEGSHA